MANCADYQMRVKGDYITIIRFLHLLNGDGPKVFPPDDAPQYSYKVDGEPDWLGRTGHDEANVAIIHEIDFNTGDLTGVVFAEIFDYAAWNVGSVVDASQGCHHSIQDFCKVYGMEMEVFCREDGEGFSEYYYVDKEGNLTEDGCDHSDIGEGLKTGEDGYWDEDEFEEKYQEMFPWDFHCIVNGAFGRSAHRSLGEIVKETDPDWDHDPNFSKLETNW